MDRRDNKAKVPAQPRVGRWLSLLGGDHVPPFPSISYIIFLVIGQCIPFPVH